jgi:hypothetical protein
VNRVEETEKKLRGVAAEVFRDRHKPRPQEDLALIELNQKFNREKRRLTRINERFWIQLYKLIVAQGEHRQGL